MLPFLIIAGLLIPGNAWIAQEIRTFTGLVIVLILPGYALARGLRLFERFDNLLDALSLSVALSWSCGLVLWQLFFFLSVPLHIVSLAWLGITIIALIASSFVSLPAWLKSRPKRPLLVGGLALWIVALTIVAYLYGSLMSGDSYSYMSWLRNITVGDIQPGANIHASWEAGYPFFKNLYAPTLLYYAMSGFLAQVDPNWVWTHAPAFWVPVMLAVQFSLAYKIFKHKVVGYVALFLAPLAGGMLRLISRLGNSHTICDFIFLPMAFWLFLFAIFAKRKSWRWAFPLAVLVAISLTFEHLPHIIHYLLVVGTFAVLCLLSNRTDLFWRNTILIITILLLVAPFLWHTWNLATAYGFDASKATEINLNMSRVQRAERFLVLGGEDFFIVRPRRLLSPSVVLGLIVVIQYAGYLWRGKARKMIIASWGIAFFIAFNPWLTPFLSRKIAPHATFRLGEAIIVFPVLAYGIIRAAFQIRSLWRHTHQLSLRAIAFLIVCIVLTGYRVGQTSKSSLNEKIRGVVYTPAEVSPNLTDRLIRQTVETKLASPPYPILNPPACLTSYLNAPTLNYIRKNISEDSVFLAERLTEYNLPAYVDQLTYLGRKGWPEWGNICPRVREEGADIAFPNVKQPEVHHRLEVACAVLNPDASVEEIQDVLIANQSEIDYILVTPNTAYLEAPLDQIMPQGRVYTGDEFIIYAVEIRESS